MFPVISVCMATFNGERYLGAQLDSILRSPLVGEVVISDDGSQDGTRALIEKCRDPRVRLIEGPRAGPVRNFEHLLSQAKGDQIFLADQDDVWCEGKVELMAQALGACDLVVSDCVVVDGDLAPLAPSFFQLRSSGPGLLRNLLRNGYIGCCMAFNRSLLTQALPFPRHTPMHDWWLGLVAEAFATVSFLSVPLVLYRRHEANASATAGSSSAAPWLRLAWRICLAANLARRWAAVHKARKNRRQAV